MNYELIVTLGAIFMAVGLMALIWSQLNEKDQNAGAYLPFLPGLFTLGGVMMILVGFLSPILILGH